MVEAGAKGGVGAGPGGQYSSAGGGGGIFEQGCEQDGQNLSGGNFGALDEMHDRYSLGSGTGGL